MNYKKFKNSVHPTKDQMSGFLEGKDDKPISMINLLKYKEKAEYEDGRETDLTGEEAYAIYGKDLCHILHMLLRLLGRFLFHLHILLFLCISKD